jgi:hypothetical protein
VQKLNRSRLLISVILILLLCANGVLHAQEVSTRPFELTSNQSSEFIAPGIEHLQFTRGFKSETEATGPWFINMLRIDLSKARLQMVHAMDEAVGLETVSSIAARYGALAAVNSGFFRVNGTYRGESVGLQVLNGKLLSEPNNARAAVGLIDGPNTQQIIFGHLKFSGQLISRGSSHDINGLNRPRDENELVIFTPEFHRTTLTNPNGLEIIVRHDRISEVRDLKGSSLIPADGFVVSAAGSARDWALKNLKVGAVIRFQTDLSPIELDQATAWRKAGNIIGGGPQLIRKSQIDITNAAEKILPAFVNDGHPRTAIAQLNSGQLLLVTVDGRQPGESIGISLTMLSDLLLEFGAVAAVNLDGGGSTTMVIKNKVVNKPSDVTGERPISDAILVYPR